MIKRKLSELFSDLTDIDKKITTELFSNKKDQFKYNVQQRVVQFQEDIKLAHKGLKTKLAPYVLKGHLLFIITSPVIYAMIIPAMTLHVFIEIYQNICFPIYGIKKVRREDYIVIDRHKLSYLNLIEKVHCMYCGYFNGLIAYVGEIAARTEQYWCPIRHAIKHEGRHQHYQNFFDYGDAEGYKNRLEEKRSALEKNNDS